MTTKTRIFHKCIKVIEVNLKTSCFFCYCREEHIFSIPIDGYNNINAHADCLLTSRRKYGIMIDQAGLVIHTTNKILTELGYIKPYV